MKQQETYWGCYLQSKRWIFTIAFLWIHFLGLFIFRVIAWKMTVKSLLPKLTKPRISVFRVVWTSVKVICIKIGHVCCFRFDGNTSHSFEFNTFDNLSSVRPTIAVKKTEKKKTCYSGGVSFNAILESLIKKENSTNFP